jgi:hypothetical protein
MMAKQDIPMGAIRLELAVPGRAFVREAKRRGFKITVRSGPAEVVEETLARMGWFAQEFLANRRKCRRPGHSPSSGG